MQLVIPNSFSPNTVALSGLVDANFTQVATIVNSGIDYGNINTTSGTTPGLIASIFLPTTTAQGTFSATTAGVGYTFLAGSTTAVPLAITGVSSQNADLFDVNLVAAGTKVFKIDKLGQGSFTSGATGSTPLAVNMIASQSVDGAQFNGNTSISANILAAYLTAGGTAALALTSAGVLNIGSQTVESTSAGDAQFGRSASTGAIKLGGATDYCQIDYGIKGAATQIGFSNKAGNGIALFGTVNSFLYGTGGLQIQPTINSTNTFGYVPPVYTNAGAATASTMHTVIGTFSGTGGEVNITFTNNAVWASSTSYLGIAINTSAGTILQFENISTSSAQTAGATSNGATYTYIFWGT